MHEANYGTNGRDAFFCILPENSIEGEIQLSFSLIKKQRLKEICRQKIPFKIIIRNFTI